MMNGNAMTSASRPTMRIAHSLGVIAFVQRAQRHPLGETWTRVDQATDTPLAKKWTDIAGSADGTKVAMAVSSGNLWMSVDSGVSWTEINSTDSGIELNQEWTAIRMSADGTKLAALESTNGKIWISADHGVSWTQPTTGLLGTTEFGMGLEMSADGSTLVAYTQTGSPNVLISRDSGATWTEDTSAPTVAWLSMAMSADGILQFWTGDAKILTNAPAPPSPPPSPPESPPPPEEDPCFPSDAIVTKADGTPSRIDALKEGDTIVAATAEGTLTTDTVSFISIAKPEIKGSYVALSTAVNKTLTLTPGHHVPVGSTCCSTLRQAKDVEVGEKMWTVTQGKATATAVTAKATSVEATGLHSPVLTNGGFPIIDGLVTSFDSIDKVTLAKHGLAPLVKACKATGTCESLRGMFLSTEDHHYIA
jgi:hypothetical protein